MRWSTPNRRLGAILLFLEMQFGAMPASAFDEIQVYNAEIAEVGQWTIEQHLNYAFKAPNVPDFPGGIVPNHALNGTPEVAYGLTPWWELGFYAPFAVTDNQFLSDGAKIRTLFVVPHAADRTFFYGVNFEFAYGTPRFSQSLFNIEMRPIIGVRNEQWEFIVNPIVDFGTGRYGEADFVPQRLTLLQPTPSTVWCGARYPCLPGQPEGSLDIASGRQAIFLSRGYLFVEG